MVSFPALPITQTLTPEWDPPVKNLRQYSSLGRLHLFNSSLARLEPTQTSLRVTLGRTPSQLVGRHGRKQRFPSDTSNAGTLVCVRQECAHRKRTHILGWLGEEAGRRTLLFQLLASDISAHTSRRRRAAVSISHSY